MFRGWCVSHARSTGVPCVPCVSRLPPVSFYRYMYRVCRVIVHTHVATSPFHYNAHSCAERLLRHALVLGPARTVHRPWTTQYRLAWLRRSGRHKTHFKRPRLELAASAHPAGPVEAFAPDCRYGAGVIDCRSNVPEIALGRPLLVENRPCEARAVREPSVNEKKS
jgi:hypothetical protein